MYHLGNIIGFLFVICGVTVSIEPPLNGKMWALLVAGSSGYDNYRHQADVCHAFQILRNNGIPSENIIVMMVDDIAFSSENPTPGVIINKPNGTDVYKNVNIDYKGHHVNSTNFLNVLTGKKDEMMKIGTGRVIESGPQDHIFVNFVDHGAPGLLAFPEEELYAPILENALKSMVQSKKFKRMVLYVEACESGSMFQSFLPDYFNIFVTTAADPTESSYACYYDDIRKTYLGDVFSVSWMEDSDKENLLWETLHHQFEVVRILTNTSHVEEYGNLNIGSMRVSEFLGFHMNAKSNGKVEESTSNEDAVSNRHVPIAVIQKQLEISKDPDQKRKLEFQLHKILKLRNELETTVANILLLATDGNKNLGDKIVEMRSVLSRKNYQCYEGLAKHFSKKCYKFSKNSYAFSQLYQFVNVCEIGIDENLVMAAMERVCSAQLSSGIV